MESHGEKQINSNLYNLLRNTRCTPQLLALFVQRGLLIDSDVEEIESKLTPSARSYELFRILKTRKQSYEVVIEVLGTTGQSGAVDNLTSGYSAMKRTSDGRYDVGYTERKRSKSSELDTDANKHLELHRAVRDGDEKEVIKILQNQNLDVLKSTNCFGTTLHVAVLGKDKRVAFRIIRCLIDSGKIDLETKANGFTFLHRLCAQTDLPSEEFHNFVKYLVENGLVRLFNIESDNSKDTPFQSLVENRKVTEKTLQLLVTPTGANCNAVREDGLSVLGSAIQAKRTANLIRDMIQCGANVKRLYGILHVTVKFGDDCELEEISDLLIDAGADVNAIDSTGSSVLDTAIHANRSLDYIKYLVEERDAKIMAENGKNKRNVLHTSAERASIPILEYFLEKGVLDVNSPDKYGDTPLHRAVVSHNNPDILDKVKLLIAKNADTYSKTKRKLTPLEMAMQKDHTKEMKSELEKILGKQNASCEY